MRYLSRWCGRVPAPDSIRSECFGLSYVMQCLISSLTSKRLLVSEKRMLSIVFGRECSRKHRRIILKRSVDNYSLRSLTGPGNVQKLKEGA